MLEQQLNDLDPSVRRRALAELACASSAPVSKPEVNIHFHTFFSFNAEGWSPSRIAWEARKYGLAVAGIVDFDVLDGAEEFLQAGELLRLKTTAGLESRVFVKEYADKVLNSPNEPGIHYFMAQGCPSNREASVSKLKEIARERNIALMERVNAYLGNVTLDYDRDVLPLTPSGNATERHLLLAYDKKNKEVLGGGAVAFWANILGAREAETRELMSNTPAFHEKMRSKLMKFGGVAYVAPDSGSFPSLEEVVELAKGIGAIPTTTWLDGTSEGESDMMANLELFVSKGSAAMNIIPDRNWNIEDSEEKAIKVANLRKAVEAARAFDLPLSVGTEMNKAGLPFVDNFSAPELADYVRDFISGAHFFYGHTLLARYADFGYYSEGAEAAFGDDRKAKNRFFAEAGAAASPDRKLFDCFKEQAGQWEPGGIIELLMG